MLNQRKIGNEKLENMSNIEMKLQRLMARHEKSDLERCFDWDLIGDDELARLFCDRFPKATIVPLENKNCRGFYLDNTEEFFKDNEKYSFYYKIL